MSSIKDLMADSLIDGLFQPFLREIKERAVRPITAQY